MSQVRATALVFDFDGTIVDTETPVYESWRMAFEAAGVEPIALSAWLETIGRADDSTIDVRAVLCARLGVEAVPASIDAYRRDVRDQLLAEQPIREGVLDWIAAAVAAEVPLAIASSSPTSWVAPHLRRIGLHVHFTVISCADPGVPGKPDPTVYRRACRQLGADPARAVAIEDSHHGVSAAVAAGMSVLAVPGPLTRAANFDHASVRADSLASLIPADWLGAQR